MLLQTSSFKLFLRKEDLSRLTHILEVEQKRSNSTLYAFHSSRVPFPNSTMSSKKSKWVMEREADYQIKWIFLIRLDSLIKATGPFYHQ